MSVAAIGAIIGIAGTAYSIYSQEQAKNAASSLKPRPFVPVDIPQVAAMALATDEAGYKISDADWRARFPKLALGRDFNINDVGANLSGETSPTITNAMDKAGLSANLGNTEYEKAKNLGLPITSIQQRDRNYFQKQLAMNPQRTAGLSGTDTTRLAIANTGNQSNFNQGVFQSRIAGYNAGIQQNIQNTNAGINALGSLAGLLAPRTTQSGYLSPEYYNRATGGSGSAGASGGYG